MRDERPKGSTRETQYPAKKRGLFFFLKMQIKLFTISITDNGAELDELNKFLKTHKVIECSEHLVSSPKGANWCFCVKYIDTMTSPQVKSFTKKKDYKEELDEKTFKIFSALRGIRKQIAAEDVLPAYAICTDEELAAMAGLTEINKSGLLSVKGFGEKKFEKFGGRIIQKWTEREENNTSPGNLDTLR